VDGREWLAECKGVSGWSLGRAVAGWVVAWSPGKMGGPKSCSCWGHVTLAERGGYDICSECGREDDGQDNHDQSSGTGWPQRECKSRCCSCRLHRTRRIPAATPAPGWPTV